MRFKFGAVILLFLMVSAFPAGAQLYKPFTFFRVIKTEHFDIIFPKESEPSAVLLASYADRTYNYISALLGIEVPGRIPVTLAPHTDMFNGYMNMLSKPHIVLYDTPMDLEWTNFANNLESLFIHELTHAVSLSSRDNGSKNLHRIFGGWVTPTFIHAPLFMVEGVTVSTESLTGFGRANDPLIKQKLRQALYEEKFPTPFQVSGVNDGPGQGANYYEYGGLFSAWLRQTYGQEKYAELWQALGGNGKFSFFVYRSGYYYIFKKVYGIDFLDAWKSFGDSLALDNIEENPDEILPKRRHFSSEKETFFNGLAALGGNVYILDNKERKIHVYNTRTKAVHSRSIGAVASYDIDAGARGLLVSSYSLVGERYLATVSEYNAVTLRKTGRKIHGLYKARYFRDGVIGLRSELHNNCIVYEDFTGKKETLFRGNEELMFSGPQAVDNERMVFIAARKGIRELWLYNYVSQELFRFEMSSETMPKDETANNWSYIRGLGVSEGKLFFSHAADDRLYKLAGIDLEKMEVVWSSRDFSGGVFNPVSVDGSVYYRGSFFSRDGILLFPETADALSGTRSSLRLAELDKEESGFVSNTVITAKSPKDKSPETITGSGTWETKTYHSIKYMNPFQFWLPLPLIRAYEDNISLDGAGLFSLMIDPTDRNIFYVLAYADIGYLMAGVDTFLWQNTSLGFPLTLEFSDKVEYSPGNEPYRDTRVNLSGSQTWSMGQWFPSFSLGGMYASIATDNGKPSAYQWETEDSAFALFAGFSFTNRQRYQYEMFGTGFYFGARAASLIDTFKPRIEGLLQASAETRFPLNIALYGVYDETRMNLHGVSKKYGDSLYANFTSTEYYSVPDLVWIAGGEASIGLFSAEIQKSLSHAYFNRIYGVLSVKNVLYDSGGHPNAEGIPLSNLLLAQSLLFKVSLVSGFIPIKMNPVFIEPTIMTAWNFSNTITGKGYQFYTKIGVDIRL